MPDLSIRPARPTDADSIQAIYAPIVEHTIISFEEIPPSIDEMARRIEATSRDYPYLVAERGGIFTGDAYASQHRTRAAYRSSVDVTVYIAEAARRSGVGQALYAELLPELEAVMDLDGSVIHLTVDEHLPQAVSV